ISKYLVHTPCSLLVNFPYPLLHSSSLAHAPTSRYIETLYYLLQPAALSQPSARPSDLLHFRETSNKLLYSTMPPVNITSLLAPTYRAFATFLHFPQPAALSQHF